MAYLGLSPEPYFENLSRSFDEQCLYFCERKAARDAAHARGETIFTMEYFERPPGCMCAGEDAQRTMTPQEIERFVKSGSASTQGSGLAVAAILSLLILGA